jgi:phosphoribosylformimino-5-aminoimidazole carboxamide ribotide isomerase
MFLPIPAIDLMSGEVVRLSRGEASQKTVYSNDPVGFARQFFEAGARRLHVVDLDGAFRGQPENLPIVQQIRKALPEMKIELGGGLRTRADVERVLGLGIDFAILGTSAVRNRALVAELAADYGERLIVGIDAKNSKVAVEGWVETSDLDALDFARELERLGVGTIIATDIATDGMLTGPATNFLVRLAEGCGVDLIASGGIRDVNDLVALKKLNRPNLIGAITGRAVYEGHLDVADAVRALA